MTKDDLLQVEGFQEKTATKLHDGIREKIQSASLVTIMAASNIFGRGFSEKRLELIMNSYQIHYYPKRLVLKKLPRFLLLKVLQKKQQNHL